MAAISTGPVGKITKNQKTYYFSIDIANDLHAVLLAQAADVQTLICIPLYAPIRTGSKPIAVLNIHKNTVDSLAVAKYEQLIPMLAPLMSILGSLIVEL